MYEYTPQLLLSVMTTLLAVIAHLCFGLETRPRISLLVILLFIWSYFILGLAGTSASPYLAPIQVVVDVVQKILRQAHRNTSESIWSCIAKLLHPIDSITSWYRAPMRMMRAWSDAVQKIDAWLIQFATPELAEAFRSFSTGVTVFGYAAVAGLIGLGCVMGFLSVRATLFTKSLLSRSWRHWRESEGRGVEAQ